MNNIQYQLNERYRFEIKQKVQEYYVATEHLRKQRANLRNMLLPKILMKNGMCDYIYPDEYLKLDVKIESLQNLVWDSIFKAKT